jgi:hypothetical protein
MRQVEAFIDDLEKVYGSLGDQLVIFVAEGFTTTLIINNALDDTLDALD